MTDDKLQENLVFFYLYDLCSHMEDLDEDTKEFGYFSNIFFSKITKFQQKLFIMELLDKSDLIYTPGFNKSINRCKMLAMGIKYSTFSIKWDPIFVSG